jgi:hypothetical protein
LIHLVIIITAPLSPNSSPTFGERGVLEEAISFSSNDLIVPTGASLLSASAFSISLWIKGGPQSDKKIYSETGTSSAWNIGSGTGAGIDKLRIYLRDDDSVGRLSVTFNQVVYDYKWHHVVITDDSGTLEVYIDGVKDTANFDYTRTAFTATNIRFMSENGGGNFQGTIDEVATWTRVLNQSEITQLYRRGVNRVKLQVRSCDDPACSGESWLGPNNSSGLLYFSEQDNTSGGTAKKEAPSFSFSDYSSMGLNNNRYFQYKFILESIDELASPSIPTVTSLSLIAETTFSTSPNIVTSNGKKFDLDCSYDLNGHDGLAYIEHKAVRINKWIGGYSTNGSRGLFRGMKVFDRFLKSVGLSSLEYAQNRNKSALRRLLFHETFHLLDFHYSHDTKQVMQDFTLACESCCFPHDNDNPGFTEYACNACANKVQVYTPEYLKLISRHPVYLEKFFDRSLKDNKDFACNLDQLFEDKKSRAYHVYRGWYQRNVHLMFDCDPDNPIVEIPAKRGHLSDKYKYLVDIVLRIKHPHSEQLQSIKRQEGHIATVEYITRNISEPRKRTIPVEQPDGTTKIEWVPLEPNCHILRDERCMYRNDFDALERIVKITELFVMNSNLPVEQLEQHILMLREYVKVMQGHFLFFAEEAKTKTKLTRNYQKSPEHNRERLLKHAARAGAILDQLNQIDMWRLRDRPIKKKNRIKINFEPLEPIELKK